MHLEKIAASLKWPEDMWTVVVTECADWKGPRNLLSIIGRPEFQLFACKGGCAQSI